MGPSDRRVGLPALALLTGLALATALPAAASPSIAFDDAWSDVGQNGDPATYYQSSHGVTISGTYHGVIGGVSNGDPGFWNLDGPNGPAFLGTNEDVLGTPTFSFDEPVEAVYFNVGVQDGEELDFLVTARLAGAIVDSRSFSLGGASDPATGAWKTVRLPGPLDSVTVQKTGGDYFAFGIDNLSFVPTHLDRIEFDDALAALGVGADPASFYAGSLGVTLSGEYHGLVEGVANGDFGNWDLDGTSGPALLGSNADLLSSPTFAFGEPVPGARLDVGVSNGDIVLQATARLEGSIVASASVSIVDTSDGTGIWRTLELTEQLDSITVRKTGGSDFAFGIDNVAFVPEPIGPAGAVAALGALALLRRGGRARGPAAGPRGRAAPVA